MRYVLCILITTSLNNHNIMLNVVPVKLTFYPIQTILWYMSKEVTDQNGNIQQVFSFWAKLMVIGEATADVCRYPSQTSILSRNGEPAWQSLSSTRTITPPIVELMD